jgi:hypothetical protein
MSGAGHIGHHDQSCQVEDTYYGTNTIYTTFTNLALLMAAALVLLSVSSNDTVGGNTWRL